MSRVSTDSEMTLFDGNKALCCCSIYTCGKPAVRAVQLPSEVITSQLWVSMGAPERWLWTAKLDTVFFRPAVVSHGNRDVPSRKAARQVAASAPIIPEFLFGFHSMQPGVSLSIKSNLSYYFSSMSNIIFCISVLPAAGMQRL